MLGHAIAGLHGEFDSAPIDGPDLLSIAGGLEHLPGRAKRIRNNDGGPGANIVLVRFTYGIRMSEDGSPTPCDFVHRYASSLKFGAHGTVNQDDPVCVELMLPGFFHTVSSLKLF
jgi:hypothetical protein